MSEGPVDFLDFVGDDIVASLGEPSVVGLGILNDVRVHHVTGMVPAAALGGATLLRDFDIGGTGELEVVYWIGVDDSLIRRFVAEGTVELSGNEKVDLFMSVEVSDFGGVVVQEPQVGRVSDATVRLSIADPPDMIKSRTFTLSIDMSSLTSWRSARR